MGYSYLQAFHLHSSIHLSLGLGFPNKEANMKEKTNKELNRYFRISIKLNTYRLMKFFLFMVYHFFGLKFLFRLLPFSGSVINMILPSIQNFGYFDLIEYFHLFFIDLIQSFLYLFGNTNQTDKSLLKWINDCISVLTLTFFNATSISMLGSLSIFKILTRSEERLIFRTTSGSLCFVLINSSNAWLSLYLRTPRLDCSSFDRLVISSVSKSWN